MELIEILQLYLDASEEVRNQIDLLLADYQPQTESPESLDCTIGEI